VQNGAALRAGSGEQVLKSDHMRSVLTRRLREAPEGAGIEKYLPAIPTTGTHVVDCTLEIEPLFAWHLMPTGQVNVEHIVEMRALLTQYTMRETLYDQCSSNSHARNRRRNFGPVHPLCLCG
jgi:hypothetical protein